MNTILTLPIDIGTEIASYIVQQEDILAFCLASKYLQSLAFAAERSLEFNASDPIVVHNYIITQDWSRLTKLAIINVQFDTPLASLLLDKMTIISSLNYMKEIVLCFDTEDEKNTKLEDAISKMTWLETFVNSTLPFPANIGDFFQYHTRLTFLASTATMSHGYERLTQVKHLALARYDTNEAMMKVLELTNLTSLDIRETNVTMQSLQYIPRLPNLERIHVGSLCNLAESTVIWKGFTSLSKLTCLPIIMYHSIEQSINDFSSFSRLTKLGLYPDGGNPISTQIFACLTDLRELNIENNITNNADFSPLVNLTLLKFLAPLDLVRITFPPKLKVLTCHQIPSNTQLLEIICNTTTLQKLDIQPNTYHSTLLSNLLAPYITSLTNLQSLILRNLLTTELCYSLTKLPALRKIYFTDLWERCVDALMRIDQLVEVWVDVDHQIEMPQTSLPFAVYVTEAPYKI